MRISDWSSDVCSSDLAPRGDGGVKVAAAGRGGPLRHRIPGERAWRSRLGTGHDAVPACRPGVVRQVAMNNVWFPHLTSFAPPPTFIAGRAGGAVEHFANGKAYAEDRTSTRLNSSHY